AGLHYPQEVKADALLDAAQLAVTGQKMTLLTISKNGRVEVREGTGALFGGKPMILAKGSSTRGHYLEEALNVAAVLPGYGKGQKLVDEYNARAATVPVVEKLHLDGIPVDQDEPIEDISAVFMIDGPD